MTVYTIVVKGELGDIFSGAFEGMTLHAGHGETQLVGDIVDQARLQGVLSQVADLGLVLLRVSQTDSAPIDQAGPGLATAGRHMNSFAAVDDASTADEITKLVALNDSGAITQAELDTAKAKALA